MNANEVWRGKRPEKKAYALSRAHSRTSSMTVQMCFTHCVMAWGVPEMVTALSVESGSRSPATWTWAPVLCHTAMLLVNTRWTGWLEKPQMTSFIFLSVVTFKRRRSLHIRIPGHPVCLGLFCNNQQMTVHYTDYYTATCQLNECADMNYWF